MKNSVRLFTLALSGVASSALAQGFVDPGAIDRQVAAFLGVDPADATGAFVPVDRRLRLAPCTQALSLSWPGTRRDAVLVECYNVWKIYVRTIGQTQAPPAVAAVKRGQQVNVSVRGPGFSVTQSAQALEDGKVGDWVRVRVGKDGEMQAKVTRPGAVAVDLQS